MYKATNRATTAYKTASVSSIVNAELERKIARERWGSYLDDLCGKRDKDPRPRRARDVFQELSNSTGINLSI